MSISDESYAFDGAIVGLHTEAHILWRIPDYFSEQKADFFYESPYFHFLGSNWNFSIYPNGRRENSSVGLVGLYVHRREMFKEYDMFFTMSILNGDVPLCERQNYCYDCLDGSGWDDFMERRILLNNQFLVAPHGTLTIKFVGEPMRTKNFKVSETKVINGVNGLSRDFLNLLSGRQATDVNVRVKSQIFPAHKLILGARSTVFATMFQHNTKVKSTGLVNIEDCDPFVFQKVLSFMYSGKIDDLNSENVIEVFSLANKYDVSDLRQICTDFMKENLCLSMVCNALEIADKFRLEELKKSATELILSNIHIVMSTEKWIYFIRENPVLTTEILKKAFSKG